MAQQRNDKLQRLFDAYYEERLQLFPVEATAAGDHRYDDQLPNDGATPYIAATRTFYHKYLQALEGFNRASLNETDRISYDVLRHLLRADLAATNLHREYMPMNQFISTPLQMAQFGAGGSIQPFHSVMDYERWAKRMSAFKEWADTAIANFNKGIKAGIVLPKALVIKMIPQMEALAEEDTAKNVFYKPLAQFPASFSAADRQRIRALYHQVITTRIIPAYQQLAGYLKTQYLPAAQAHAGLSALPGGDKLYNYYLHYFTTDPKLTAEQVYQTGLAEVARITREMETIREKVGFKGSLPEFFHYLTTDARFMPFKTPEQVLDAYRAINRNIRPFLGNLFSRQPQTKFEVRRVEAYREASQAGPSYVFGNLEENRPGILYVPVPDATRINTVFYGVEATFIHEAIPGHHFQISFQQENKTIPAFRKQPSFFAYLEGWALYCESLGEQLGCYTDPYQKMGALCNEMHRAIRLVLDVAIHTGKMTREEAIAYMMAREPVSEAIATAEVERYMAWPGQALSYKIGEIKIKTLRDKYARQLGDQFSLRQFHDALLQYGDMPLDVLEDYLDNWATGLSTAHTAGRTGGNAWHTLPAHGR
ncbi:DUF885 domain-containing protein [Chitinophaga japonensis]|nr:DUF885 domain-containing protein [Chitinophaga japonensis]